MNRIAIGVVAFVLPASLAAQLPDSTVVRIDRLFAAWATDSTPGCVLGIAQRGRQVMAKAYGMSNLEYGIPLTPDAISETGSVAKQFTAAAIALLAQDGRLTLDDDVRKYIPEVPDFGQVITIRHLLNHSSGLRDQWGLLGMAGRPPGSAVHTIPEILRLVSRQRDLNFPVGSEYLYSNTGYTLLGVIVQRVSGMSFAEFTRRRIFEPLGMRDTQWRDDYRRVVRRRATAYDRGPGGYRLDMPFTMVHGNGGLLTTVGDLLTWNDALDSGHVGRPSITPVLETRGRLTGGRTIDYALGLSVSENRPGVREVGHSGSTAGYQTFLGRFPDQTLSIALLCNAGNANASALAHQVVDLFLPPRAAAPVDAPVDDGELAAIAGAYRDPRTDEVLRFSARDHRLGVVAGGAGGPLVRSADRTFESRGITYRFEPATGATARVVRREQDGAETTYERLVPPAGGVAVGDYVGSYRSPELEATFVIAERDGRLEVRPPIDDPFPLVPLYADGFSAGGTTIRFVRDGAGRVQGLRVFAGRVRNLRFDKAPDPR